MEQRFERLEEEQKQLAKRLSEIERKQQTEPIKISRIELDMGDIRERFDAIEQSIQVSKGDLQQELHSLSDNWLDSLQENIDDIKSDIRTTQGTQNERFDKLDRTIATLKTEHGAKLDSMQEQLALILTLLQK